MFYFIAIKTSLWMLFTTRADYKGNFVCGPKRENTKKEFQPLQMISKLKVHIVPIINGVLSRGRAGS